MGHYDWMDTTFVERLMEKMYPPSAHHYVVGDWTMSPAVGKGENYSSQLKRVEVQLTKSTISFIVKSLPEGDFGSMIMQNGMWVKELTMYTTTLPIMKEIIGCKLNPDMLACLPTKEMVLEDIKPKGYRTVNRQCLLDYEHYMVAIDVIAKFHAASVAAKGMKVGDIEFVGREIFYNKTKTSEEISTITSIMICLANEVEKWPESSEFAPKIRKLSHRMFELLIESSAPREFNVLNHGDLWSNNIMFKYDKTGRLRKAKLVDFQNCRYTTPAHDLQYFIISSVEENLRETRLDELLSIYLRCLNNQLQLLECKTLSMETLKKDMLATNIYGFYVAATTLSSKVSDTENPLDFEGKGMEDFLSTDNERNPFGKTMKGKIFREMMPKLLIYFEKKGLFDD